MGMQTVLAAPCKCAMGTAPGVLIVLPLHRTLASCLPAANINDHIPFLNILPFGQCLSLGNPITAALTAAALGVLTPGPCLPMTAPPWAPGAPTVILDNMPALNNSSKAICCFGGVVQINFAGQVPVMIP